jgi:4-carboxymuconolactone decarboxylase
MDTAERKKRGLQLLNQMLGAAEADLLRKNWEQLSPDLAEYIVEFVAGEIWSRQQLDLRTKSLVTVAALAAMGRTRALELNLRIALNNGASRQEIVETFLHLAPYAGFPAAWEGLFLASKVFEETGN